MNCHKKIRPEWIPAAYTSPDTSDKQAVGVGIKPFDTAQVAQIVRSHNIKRKVKLR